MMSETVDGVTVMIRLHQEIAVDLRHDRRGGDGDAAAVAFDEGNLRHLQCFEGDGVEEEDVGADLEILNRVRHGQLAGAEDVDGVDGLRLDHTDSYGAGATEDLRAERGAVVAVEELGVVDPDHGGVAVEDDAAGDDRAGQAAAPNFVDAGDGA